MNSLQFNILTNTAGPRSIRLCPGQSPTDVDGILSTVMKAHWASITTFIHMAGRSEDQGFLDLFRSSILSISTREAAFTNSETDLNPNSECDSINPLMFRYNSSGILTSLYDFATSITYKAKIKRIFDTYVEIFINRHVFRHLWRIEVGK